MNNEEWKEVEYKGYLYLVSSYGRIKIFCDLEFKPMEIKQSAKGLDCASGFCGEQKLWVEVHRLVAIAFLGETPNRKVIIHKDFNRNNNHADNLEFTTKNMAIKRWSRKKKLSKLLESGNWKDIEGYENYMISDQGIVLSKERVKYLKPTKKESGCFKVGLTSNGSRNSITVHKLVANAFIGKRPDGAIIKHIDKDNSNNAVDNLKYSCNI